MSARRFQHHGPQGPFSGAQSLHAFAAVNDRHAAIDASESAIAKLRRDIENAEARGEVDLATAVKARHARAEGTATR